MKELVCRYLLITHRRSQVEINDTQFAATGLVTTKHATRPGDGFQLIDLQTGDIVTTNFDLLENVFSTRSVYIGGQKNHYLRQYLQQTSKAI